MDEVVAEPGDGGQVLGPFVREQRRLAGLSLRKLSELSGVSNPYLSQVERGLRRPSAAVLRRLAVALEVSVEAFYVRAGMLAAAGPPVELAEAIRRAPELSEAQKRTLLHVYSSFREGSGASDAAGSLGSAAVSTGFEQRESEQGGDG